MFDCVEVSANDVALALTVKAFRFCEKLLFVARWTVKPTSLAGLPSVDAGKVFVAKLHGVGSVQLSATAGAGAVAATAQRPWAQAGYHARAPGTPSGRIMSFSSWPSMWQCHTYSQPKLVSR